MEIQQKFAPPRASTTLLLLLHFLAAHPLILSLLLLLLLVCQIGTFFTYIFAMDDHKMRKISSSDITAETKAIALQVRRSLANMPANSCHHFEI